jgi:toxin secretion/phage lysis holin
MERFGEILMKVGEYIKCGIIACGGLFGWLLGGWDKAIQVLLVFVLLDFVTGWIAAFVKQEVSASEALKGIFKKLLIICVVVVAALIDYVLEVNGAVRMACLFLFIASEGTSILENAARIGVPIPDKLRNALKLIKDKTDK